MTRSTSGAVGMGSSLAPLQQRADSYADRAVATSTHKLYSTGWRTFCNFMTLSGIYDFFKLNDGDRHDLFVNFVTYCADTLFLSYTSIKSYLCGVKYHVCCRGGPDPYTFSGGQPFLRLQYVLKGIKKNRGITTQPRLPVTIDILTSMVSALNRGVYNPYVDSLLRATFTMAFFGFLRCGEFTTQTGQFDPSIHLTLADVSIKYDPSPYLSIHLSSSKTDPFRKGVQVKLFPLGNSLCPLSAVSQYLAFRMCYSTSSASPFFLMPTCLPLTRTEFTSLFQGVLQCIGLHDSRLKPHSFRIGAATTAAQAHLPDHLIKTLGRWSSDAYLRYIRTPTSLLAQAQSDIARGGVTCPYGAQ